MSMKPPKNGQMRGYKPSSKPSISGVGIPMEATSISQRFESVHVTDKLNEKLGFPRYESGPKKVGWLVNMHSVSLSI